MIALIQPPADSHFDLPKEEKAPTGLFFRHAPNRGFRYNHGIAERQRQQNINQQENAASVLCCQIRKSPDISQPDRCSRSRQDISEFAGKAASFVMFHFQSLSLFVKYVFTIPYFHQKGFLNFRSIFMHLCKFLDDVVPPPPPRGDAKSISSRLIVGSISIHAPAKGATVEECKPRYGKDWYFNHAPAKGATQTGYGPLQLSGFQPRSREGSDRLTTSRRPGNIFQSTLPRRERRDPDMPVLGDHIFQPRSREGATPATFIIAFTSSISIHAPAKGATQLGNTFGQAQVFNHAPAKGATM